MAIERIVYQPEELRALLGIGRTAAYQLAQQIGTRFGRRLLVPRARLEEWLSETGSGTVESRMIAALRTARRGWGGARAGAGRKAGGAR